MKKLIITTMLVLLTGVSFARADEKQPDEKRVNSSQIKSDETDSSKLMMKIQDDEKTDASRRQVFIEELRKLYKANFL